MSHPQASMISPGTGNNRLADLLAQYFGTGIAEGLLRCRIKLDNRPRLIDADNTIQCGLPDSPFPNFTLPQRLLRSLAFRDLVLQFLIGGSELCGAFANTVLQALV